MKMIQISTFIRRAPARVQETSLGQGGLRLGNKWKLICGMVAVLGGGAIGCLASDPVGIYAFVDKVVMEPSEGTPERVQVWGGFALAQNPGDRYAPAQRGYMYFKIKEGKEEICRNEWNDLKSVAGTGQIVTFGSRYAEKGTVRKADAKPEKPDTYPIGWGMTKTKRTDYGPVKDLQALREGAASPKKDSEK